MHTVPLDATPHSLHVRQRLQPAREAGPQSSATVGDNEDPNPILTQEDETTGVELGTDEKGNYTVTGPKANYLARSDHLRSWSFVETEMAFSCNRIRCKASRLLPLQGTHPHASQYGHIPRSKASMCLPQFIRECPLMPSDTASPEEKDIWASFALGAFFPYDTMLEDLEGDTLWDKVTFWRAHKPRGDFDVFAFRCLDNIQERAIARLHIRQDAIARKAKWQQMRDAARATGKSFDGGDMPSDSDDSGIWEAAFDDTAMGPEADLRAELQAAMAYEDIGQSSSFVFEALATFRDATSAVPIKTAIPSKVAFNSSRDFQKDMSRVQDQLKAGKDSIPIPPPTDTKRKLHIFTDPQDGTFKAKVSFVDAITATAAEKKKLLEQNKRLLKGSSPPPYIRLASPPTVQHTISLFRLDTEQQFPLRIMIHTLESDVKGEAPDQLLMSIMGGAGTGKSEVIKAFLWHAYQHGLNDRIAVTSYTWKAALLVGNEHNPAFSTTSLFGTAHKYNKTNGGTNKCMSLLHPNIRFVIHDELSFDSQAHFGVSHVLT